MRQQRYRATASFIMGLAIGFLPSFALFAAIVYSLAGRRLLTLNDAVWLLGAITYSAPILMHTGLVEFMLSFLTIAAPWLLYRAVRQLPHSVLNRRHWLGVGILSSLGIVVLLGLLQIEQLHLEYSNALQAIVWKEHPALFGHGVLALGIASVLLNEQFRFKLLSLLISALGILVSGAREAAIAWLLFAICVPFLDRQLRGNQRLLAVLATVGVLAFMSLLGAAAGWGRSGFLVDLVPTAASAGNLVQSSEVPHSSWWLRQNVTVTSDSVRIDGADLITYTVTKVNAEPWVRLQQVIPLTPGETYTVSTWLQRPEGDALPGIQGWGELSDGTAFTAIATLRGNRLLVRGSGVPHLLDSGIAEVEGDWLRIFFTITVPEQEELIHWYVGLVPDDRAIAHSTQTFAGFQVKRGATLTPYEPGISSRGVGIDVARAPYWQAAWHGFKSSPLIGANAGFSEYFETNFSERERYHGTPAHAHNLFLQTMYDRGLLGLIGLALVLLAIITPALRNFDAILLIAISAVLFANWLDLSFFYGAVLYPLVAIAAWRHPQATPAETETSSKTLIARLSLAATDYIAVLLSFGITVAFLWWTGALKTLHALPDLTIVLYALLLWPVMVLREGIYPGYGTPRPIELKKHVTGIVIAWLVFAAATLLLPDQFGYIRSALPGLLLLSVFLGPTGRSLTKKLLVILDNWGREAIIVGTGPLASRLVKSLLDERLAGYIPLAAFTDDPTLVNSHLHGVPIKGTIDAAPAFSVKHGVGHAIVALEQNDIKLADVLTDGSPAVFRTIQYVPHLSYLPVYGVSAGSLDNILTLQVNNELLSPSRQAYKRTIDIIGAVVGGLAILPVLLGIIAAIAIDTRGNPFFGHLRIGKDGREFRAWKFRSMVPDAETRLKEYLNKHPELRNEWEETQKLQNDPRVTRVGRFLRKYSLDELPQLWNVIVGQMSLVGPRPIVESEIGKYGSAYPLYRAVRPGMTGYWQVSGRSDTDYDQRVALDGFYVRNWSVWLDIVIILRTFKVVIKGDGAY